MKGRKLSPPIEIPPPFLLLSAIPADAANPADAEAVLTRMPPAYETVRVYRVLVQVTLGAGNTGEQTEEFISTFNKTEKTRIDFNVPESGNVVVVPDEEGKGGGKSRVPNRRW
jgi:hypothetical protein